jgi:hypothetical protein
VRRATTKLHRDVTSCEYEVDGRGGRYVRLAATKLHRNVA